MIGCTVVSSLLAVYDYGYRLFIYCTSCGFATVESNGIVICKLSRNSDARKPAYSYRVLSHVCADKIVSVFI